MTGEGPPHDLEQILLDACNRAGFRSARHRLLRHFANAVYLLEDASVVVRVAYGPDAVDRSRTAVAVARWLVATHFPVTAPARLPSTWEQPIVMRGAGEVAVTFWRHYPQPPSRRRPALRALGEVARALHRLAAPPVALATYRPLTSVSAALDHAARRGGIDATTVRWLRDRVAGLVDDYHRLDFPLGVGPIHADLYVGNLLVGDHEHPVVLGDWDSVCVGPREVDVIPTFAATRFGLDPAALDEFAVAYGYDPRDWSGYQTLCAIREVSTLPALLRLAPVDPGSARELRHRLDTLRRGDTAAIWAAR